MLIVINIKYISSFRNEIFLYVWTCHCNNETDSKINSNDDERQWNPFVSVLFFRCPFLVRVFRATVAFGMLCNESENYQNARSYWICVHVLCCAVYLSMHHFIYSWICDFSVFLYRIVCCLEMGINCSIWPLPWKWIFRDQFHSMDTCVLKWK